MIVTPVSTSPAMSARSTGAAPRQRGRSDGCTFSQSRSPSSGLGDDEAVRDGDDVVGAEIEPGLEPLGLEHRDTETSATFFAGGAASLRPRPGGASGRVEQRRDLVVLSEPFEDVGAERRGRRDRDRSRQRAPRTGCGRSLAERGAPRLVVGAVDDEDAVEVVELVLDDARGGWLELELDRLALRVDALDRDRAARARRARARHAARGSPPRRARSPSSVFVITGFDEHAVLALV